MKENFTGNYATHADTGAGSRMTHPHIWQNSPAPGAAKIKRTYRSFTALFAGLMIVSGIGYSVAAPPVVEGMMHLGYPFYLIRFLGIAKLLGAVAILSGRFPRIKEWAYAGFAFNLLGAIYSHICSGDGPRVLVPLVVLSLGTGSHVYWHKLMRSQMKSTAA